jgi:hypothetical protein
MKKERFEAGKVADLPRINVAEPLEHVRVAKPLMHSEVRRELARSQVGNGLILNSFHQRQDWRGDLSLVVSHPDEISARIDSPQAFGAFHD